MERRTVLRAAAAVAAPWLVRARAQTRMRRVGQLWPWVDPGAPPPAAVAYWKKLGWTIDETLHVERRYAAWRMERMPELADELLRRQNVEVLMAHGSQAAVAAAKLTSTVPIVFTYAFLPIESGLIDSYARPGRNCTGLANQADLAFSQKRLEFARALAPSARRAAVVAEESTQATLSGAPLNPWPEFLAAARAQGFDETTVHIARRIEDVESALTDAAAARVQVALITGYTFVGAAPRVADYALRQRWISGTLTPWLFDAGLLMYHGPSQAEFAYVDDRRGQMVDRILRGANPADIPVEIPARAEFAFNLKAARALGVTVPQSLLLRADRVVE
jgi:putative ABC transport system substrate-binding protein